MAKAKIKYGSIVHADEIDDPDGKPAGPHYAIVLNPLDSIDAGDDLQLAVVTTDFNYPLRKGWYPLDNTPGKRGGHPKTGMSQACVVKGTWLCFLPQNAVTHRGKRAPIKLVKELREWIRQQAAAAARAKRTKPPDTGRSS